MYANKIKIKSDGNELTLVGVTVGKDKKKLINYKYTKSLTKLGMILPLTEKDYEDLLRRNISNQVE